LAHKAEKDLEEHGEKIEEADRENIKTLIGKVREVAETDETDKITEKTAELTAAVMKMGEAIYADAGADASAEAASDDADDEDVVDAEFEDVDEDDKA